MTLLDHLRQVVPGFEDAPHHRLICYYIDEFLADRIEHLAISMPPRHGKSLISSIGLPAYYLGRFPGRNIIHSSYAASLTNTFSRQVRARVRDDPAFRQLFDVPLDPEKQAVDDWRTAQGGGFYSVGVEGGISGHGAHLFIGDDLVSEQDAFSPAKIDKIWGWYARGARTRLAPGGKILLTGTRQHKYDVIGRALLNMSSPNADQFHYLKLEAISTGPDELRPRAGLALWSDWYPIDALRAIQAIDPRMFELVYQQNDRADESDLFDPEWFDVRDRVDLRASSCRRPAWFFDLALGETEQGDYTTWVEGWIDDRLTFYARNINRAVMQWPTVYNKLLVMARDRRYQHHLFVFEHRNIELLAMQQLRRALPSDGHRFVGVKMVGDKAQRAAVTAQRASVGGVVLRREEETPNLIREHADFPVVQHDDFVDVLSLAMHFYGLHRVFRDKIEATAAAARDRARERIDEQQRRMMGC